MRSVVVLPAPFGPRNPTISPPATSRLTPRTASTRPAARCPRPARPGKLFRRPEAQMTVSTMLLPAGRGRHWRVSVTINHSISTVNRI